MPNWWRSIGQLIAWARGGRQHSTLFYNPGFGPVSLEQARRNATVVACCNLIARGIAQLRFYAPGAGVNSATARVLRKPNLWQTPYEFWHSQAFDLMLHGNAMSRVFRGTSMQVQALGPLDPERVYLKANTFGAPEYQLYETNEWLSATDVVHVRDGGWHEPWARSRLESAGKRVRILIAADELINATFDAGIHVQYALTGDAEIDPTKAVELANRLKELFGKKGERRGGVGVLGGGMKLDKIPGVTPADTDMRELRSDIIREIAGHWSVPPFLVGAEGDTKYSNYTAQMLTLYRDTFVPVSIALCQKYSLVLGTEVVCDHKALLKGDLAAQVAAGVNASGGPFMTPNEARELFNDLGRLEGEHMDECRKGGSSAPPPDRRGETPTDDGEMDGETPEDT